MLTAIKNLITLDVIDQMTRELPTLTSKSHFIYGYGTLTDKDQAIANKINLDYIRGVVAGGAALRWWGGQNVDDHDIDIWFHNEQDLQAAINQLNQVGSNTITTKNAKTYLVVANEIEYTVQLISKISPTVEELFKDFDITVCRIATDGHRWWIGPQFAQDYKTKTLRMVNLRKNSLRRFVKYVNYGYQPEPQLWQALLDHPDVNWDYSTMESYEDYADAF